MPLHPALRRLARNRQFQRLLVTVGPIAAREIMKLVENGKHRQVAIRHADTLVDGRVSREHVEDELRWIVWTGDRPLGAYPPVECDLDAALVHADPERRRDPDELPTRRAWRTAADLRRATAGRLGGGRRRA